MTIIVQVEAHDVFQFLKSPNKHLLKVVLWGWIKDNGLVFESIYRPSTEASERVSGPLKTRWIAPSSVALATRWGTPVLQILRQPTRELFWSQTLTNVWRYTVEYWSRNLNAWKLKRSWVRLEEWSLVVSSCGHLKRSIPCQQIPVMTTCWFKQCVIHGHLLVTR